jgi:hypothetical protein
MADIPLPPTPEKNNFTVNDNTAIQACSSGNLRFMGDEADRRRLVKAKASIL